MKKLVIDLDGTLTIDDPSVGYEDKLPNRELVAKLADYKRDGFEIIIATARNMRTHNGNIGKINALTLPTVLAWLDKHGVPYDEVHVGKPWCGSEGFYVDDKAIRPDEFTSMSYEQIASLIKLKEPV